MRQEAGYLHLLQKILDEGEEKTGRNGGTLSLFGEQLRFDLKEGFPLLTTKNMFWRGIVEELLWFLRGDTDATTLIKKNVNIWTDNSTREFLDKRGLDYKEGQCGPIYGFQWRCFDGDYPNICNGVDQLRYVIQELCTCPASRRAVLTAWNPKQLDAMCLPPCHVMYHFSLSSSKGLSCHMCQRSCDSCAGLPFNIASTALLTHIIAQVLEVPVNEVIISIGDAHVYCEHVEGAREQIQRTPYPFPKIHIRTQAPGKLASVDDNLKWIESLEFDDFVLTDRVAHGPIKYKMIP